MKIISQDNDRLVARENNISTLFVGIVAIIIGIVISVNYSTTPIWFKSVFIVVGLLAIAFRKIVVIDFNKGTGNGLIVIKTLIKSKPVQFLLSDVKELQLVSEYQTSSSIEGSRSVTRSSIIVHLILALNSGETIDLSDKSRSLSSGMFGIGRIPGQEIGEKIAAFLVVPLVQVGAGTEKEPNILSSQQTPISPTVIAPVTNPQTPPATDIPSPPPA